MRPAKKTIFDDLVLIGIVTKPHGVKGEVKVRPLTDFPSRFQELKRVILVSKDGSQNEYAMQNVNIKNKDTIIIKFDDITHIIHNKCRAIPYS